MWGPYVKHSSLSDIYIQVEFDKSFLSKNEHPKGICYDETN